MGCITAASVKDMKRNVHYDEKKYPALLLARIATHDDYRRMGIGSHMLKYVFASALDYAHLLDAGSSRLTR
jgi:GNAT superfamily N-acetyltransferase